MAAAPVCQLRKGLTGSATRQEPDGAGLEQLRDVGTVLAREIPIEKLGARIVRRESVACRSVVIDARYHVNASSHQPVRHAACAAEQIDCANRAVRLRVHQSGPDRVAYHY